MRAAADLAHHYPSQYLPLPSEKELEFLNTEELVKIGFANREDLWRALPPNSTACATRRSRLPLAHSAGASRPRVSVEALDEDTDTIFGKVPPGARRPSASALPQV